MKLRILSCVICIAVALTAAVLPLKSKGNLKVCAYSDMPLYQYNPCEFTERSRFYTSYGSSTEERKWNISLAAKSIDNFFLEVGAEFSFNTVVGERSAKRGYKQAKIILNGEFIDGIGGGVCQVSTTLYNAAILAGLKITEYHPHSLPVSYVAPSFDAMVNSGSADLKFVNVTSNPLIINAKANGERLTVTITGEPSAEKYERLSIVREEIPAPPEETVADEKGEYPDLYEGEIRYISYSKKGYKSEGYLIKRLNGVVVSKTRIRTDSYLPRRGLIIEGRAKRQVEEENFFEDWFLNKFLPI